MSIEVLGPFSGRPVKIRPQDVGKAVRDEEGKLFYVLQRPDGSGYYSAPTKAGGARDIERYDRYMARMSGAKKETDAVSQAQIKVARKKAGTGRLLKLILVIAAIGGAAAYWFLFRGGGAK